MSQRPGKPKAVHVKLMDDVSVSKTRMLKGIWTVNTILLRVQTETDILLGTGIRGMCSFLKYLEKSTHKKLSKSEPSYPYMVYS